VNFEGIPQALRDYPYWCVWKLQDRDDKPTKVPFNPRARGCARSNDRGTFAPFADTKRAFNGRGDYTGLGIGIFDDMAAIDIDHCIDDSGQLSELAREITSTMGCYTERSPSGHGLRILFRAPGFKFDTKRYYTNNQKIGLEVYIAGCTRKYVTITGDVVHLLPIEDKSAEIAAVLEKYMCRSGVGALPAEAEPVPAPQAPEAETTAAPRPLLDDEVIAKASKSKQGAAFSALLSGDISGYKSNSEADIAFSNMLAFWCGGDLGQMDSIFRQSGLMREKWDRPQSGSTYGRLTLEKAIQDTPNVYNPDSPEFKEKLLRKAAQDFAGTSGHALHEIINPLDDKERYTPDDKGNGYLFADSFQNELRHCPEAKAWYYYDGTCWGSNSGNEAARERAKALADYLWGVVPGITDQDEQKRFVKNATALRSQPKRETMLKDAQSVYPLYQAQLDADISLINCGNYTLNINRREVSPHNPAHLLGKVAGADFVADARCERWERFIDEITMGDKETARYLQKLFGYCLTGEPKEEKLFILYGATTRNGKSTLLDTIAAVMGDYARSMLPESLAEQRNQDGGRASPDWAEMNGVRLCTVSEPSQGLHLNAAKVKNVTGRNTIKARFLHCNYFEFKPQFSIVVDTNHRPNITDATLFASNRVVIIPFNRHFEEWEQDTNLKAELLTPAARSAILLWMLQGLDLYRTEGLRPPASIQQEIAAYQHDSDKISQFMEECAEMGMGYSCQVSTVYSDYMAWCKGNGFYHESITRFGLAIKAKGYRVDHQRTGKWLIGVRVNSPRFTSF